MSNITGMLFAVHGSSLAEGVFVSSIFISYRRDDSTDFCDRITDYLGRQFGPRAVFRDTNTILAGSNFVTVLHNALAECRVMLVVIGPRWLDARDASGQRRLDMPSDFVQYEIATGLKTGMLVVPILVNGATLPAAANLPPDLAGLARCTPFVVRNDPYFASDMAVMAQTIRGQAAWRPASVSVLVASIASILVLILSTISFAYQLGGLSNNALLIAAFAFASLVSPPVMTLFAFIRSVRTHRTGWAAVLGWLGSIVLLSEITIIIANAFHQGVSLLVVPVFFALPADLLALVAFGLMGPQRPYQPSGQQRPIAHIPVLLSAVISALAFCAFIVITEEVPAGANSALPICGIIDGIVILGGTGLAFVRAWRTHQWIWLAGIAAPLAALIGTGIFFALGNHTLDGVFALIGLLIAPIILGIFGWWGPLSPSVSSALNGK